MQEKNNRRAGMSALLAAATAAAFVPPAAAQVSDQELAKRIGKENPQIIEWRRDFHEHPELSNREVRTSGIVAAHLKKLGLQVETGVAKNGVVAVLEGGRPGPTLALRADMDALPVTEQVDVPFRSRVTAEYRGETVGVMHACGHDAHTAILMGVAQVLSDVRKELPGRVIFIFQPAEEGPPPGEEGGARLMLKEGVFDRHKPDAIIGLHVHSMLPAGTVGYRPGAFMAGSDTWRMVVTGRQTHGARPWTGIDPIITAAQIVNSMQTIVSRQVDISAHPAVVTVGMIRGGVRFNIIPDTVEMMGTIRNFDPAQREQILASVKLMAAKVAEANGATATFELTQAPNPVTYNNPQLTLNSVPTLQRVLGKENVREAGLVTASEDFSYFAREVPGLFLFVGIVPPGLEPSKIAENHSPLFYVDERGIEVGARALTQLAVDYLNGTIAQPEKAAN